MIKHQNIKIITEVQHANVPAPPMSAVADNETAATSTAGLNNGTSNTTGITTIPSTTIPIVPTANEPNADVPTAASPTQSGEAAVINTNSGAYAIASPPRESHAASAVHNLKFSREIDERASPEAKFSTAPREFMRLNYAMFSSAAERSLGGSKGWCTPDEVVMHFRGAWKTNFKDFWNIPLDSAVQGYVANRYTTKGWDNTWRFSTNINQTEEIGYISKYDHSKGTYMVILFHGPTQQCTKRFITDVKLNVTKGVDERFCQSDAQDPFDTLKGPTYKSEAGDLEEFVVDLGPNANDAQWLPGEDDYADEGTKLMLQLKSVGKDVVLPINHFLHASDGSMYVDHSVYKVEHEMKPEMLRPPSYCDKEDSKEGGEEEEDETDVREADRKNQKSSGKHKRKASAKKDNAADSKENVQLVKRSRCPFLPYLPL